MSLKLTILGCHAATPRSDQHTSSQVLEINGQCFLIDCGEGTQKELRRHKIKFSKIQAVFISHLHGDHFYGLIGLISTFSLLNRTAALDIYAPKGIKEIINLQLKYSKSWVEYPLRFHELESKQIESIFENDKVKVQTVPLKHRVYTNGYLFEEKPRERNLNINEIRKHPEIEICDYQNLKNGRDFTLSDGSIISNELLTSPPPKPLSYAYISDTIFLPEIAEQLTGVDLLYHEATFLDQHADLADKTKHSTARQAAIIAKTAKVKRLLLGHFSSRYTDKDVFKKEANEEFSNVDTAFSRMEIQIDNQY